MTFPQILLWLITYPPVSGEKKAFPWIPLPAHQAPFLFQLRHYDCLKSYFSVCLSVSTNGKLHEGRDLWVLFIRISVPRML